MDNPFVYGEVVPAASFVARVDELDRLVRDLGSGQKVFLISPRRYGKSSLIRQALRATARSGALTAEITVSSYSSYLAFLEGYTRALLTMQTYRQRAAHCCSATRKARALHATGALLTVIDCHCGLDPQSAARLCFIRGMDPGSSPG